MAPGIRKASVREVLQVLENPKQLGYPGTVNADACLGFSVYAYQSSEVLFDAVGTRDDVLARLEGLRCKGHNDKRNVCQKAKVGFCPCCAIPTHVAIPNSFALGGNGIRKQQTIDLWAAFGPWGPRRFVAMKYVYESNNREPLPTGWDWAANSLRIAFPPPLIRGMCAGSPTQIATVGEARKARRQRISEARASKQVLQGHAIKDKKPEVIKENTNAMEIDTQPQAPDAKGTAPNISKDSAGSLAFSPGAKNETAKGQSEEQYLPQKGVSATKGKSPENQFNLADFIPGPSQDDSSSSNEFRRGGRRPKNPPTQVRSNWGDKNKWSNWNDWEE